jgi:hypothetical protein
MENMLAGSRWRRPDKGRAWELAATKEPPTMSDLPPAVGTRRHWLSVTTAAGLGLLGLAPRLSAAGFSRYRDRVLSKKPVGYWRLGEAAGPVAKDESGFNRQGAFHGTPMLHQPGALKHDDDTAITLDGKGSYVEIPDDPAFSVATSGQGMTVEVWMRPDVLGFPGDTTEPFIHWLGKGEEGRHEWALRFYSRATERPNRISAYIFNPGGGLGSGAYFEDALTPGQWLHIVATYDPANNANPKAGVSIYRDGALRKGPGIAGSSGALYSKYQIAPAHGAAPLRLGARDLGHHFLTGGLDEVAIYPQVLSAAEIREHWMIGSSG